MPIYEFRCEKCDKKFEKLCRMGQTEGITCPDCGREASRLFSTFFSHGGSSDAGSSRGGSSCGGCSRSSCADCK